MKTDNKLILENHRCESLDDAVGDFNHRRGQFSNLKSAPQEDTQGWTITGPSVNPSWPTNWWQMALSGGATNAKANPAVEACVGQVSRVGGLVPPDHVKDLPSGGTEKVKDSSVLKVLRKPNAYQTRADFMLNIIRWLLLEGNGYAVAIRDPDGVIKGLHPLPSNGTRHYIDPEDGEIFYYVNGNTLVPGGDMLVPAREILHLRMAVSENDPLRGITPLAAAEPSLAASNSIMRQNASFFNNMSRTSGVLSTELELDAEQTSALRKRWEEQSAGLNNGKTPVLSHGLTLNSATQSAVDAELVDSYNLTLTDIARIYGIPSALINIDSSNSTFSNVDSLLEMWVSTSLGSLINSIELKLEDMFDLPEDEHINFNLDHLLRGNLKDRMDGLGKGILAGVYSIDEARGREGLPPVIGEKNEDGVTPGETPRIQQQNVPLSFYEDDLALKRERLELDSKIADNNAKAKETETDDTDEPVAAVDDNDKKEASIISQIKRAMA